MLYSSLLLQGNREEYDYPFTSEHSIYYIFTMEKELAMEQLTYDKARGCLVEIRSPPRAAAPAPTPMGPVPAPPAGGAWSDNAPLPLPSWDYLTVAQERA
eukprot:4026200-Prymnesium_polylepis.1